MSAWARFLTIDAAKADARFILDSGTFQAPDTLQIFQTKDKPPRFDWSYPGDPRLDKTVRVVAEVSRG